MSEKKKPVVFVIMPFDCELLKLFNGLKEWLKEDYEFKHAKNDNNQNILKDIIQGLEEAKVVLADITGFNKNVFYELGIAHTMNKKVICVKQKKEDGEAFSEKLPFDIGSYRVHTYIAPKGNDVIELYGKLKSKISEEELKPCFKNHSKELDKFYDLCENLKLFLKNAIDGESKFGSPVSDFSSFSFVNEKKYFGLGTGYSYYDKFDLEKSELFLNWVKDYFYHRVPRDTARETDKEDFIRKWIEDFKFSKEMIDSAIIEFERKQSEVNCRPIAYINGILQKWHDNDIKTIYDIRYC